MTQAEIKAIVASIPATELKSALRQLDKMAAINAGKPVPFRMIGNMAVVK